MFQFLSPFQRRMSHISSALLYNMSAFSWFCILSCNRYVPVWYMSDFIPLKFYRHKTVSIQNIILQNRINSSLSLHIYHQSMDGYSDDKGRCSFVFCHTVSILCPDCTICFHPPPDSPLTPEVAMLLQGSLWIELHL